MKKVIIRTLNIAPGFILLSTNNPILCLLGTLYLVARILVFVYKLEYDEELKNCVEE